MIHTFREVRPSFTSLTRALYQVSDFKIKTVKGFVQTCHGLLGNISTRSSQGKTLGMNSLPGILSMLSNSVPCVAGLPPWDALAVSVQRARVGAAKPWDQKQGIGVKRCGSAWGMISIVWFRAGNWCWGESISPLRRDWLAIPMLMFSSMPYVTPSWGAPDTDPRYAGIDSMVLLEETMEMVRCKGCRPINLDATVFAQAPKLSPYRDAIEARLSLPLGIGTDRINIKATTTEGLGIIGSEAGMGAMAVILLESTP